MVEYETPIKHLRVLLVILISFLTCTPAVDVIFIGHFRRPHCYEHRYQAHQVNEEVAEYYFEAIKL